MKFKFGDTEIGDKSKPYIIAEVGQAHDGSLGIAHSYIDAAKKSGADAIKFQTHIASEESTREEKWRVNFSYEDASRYDYWERMEFTEEQWGGLKKHADELGIDFISTPFSKKAVQLLNKLDVPYWKVASGEINNFPLIKEMINTKKPIILSSGMSTLKELNAAVELVKRGGCPYAVMQCTSSYPCPAEKVGLNVISQYLDFFDCPVGLSDHSGDIYSSVAAASIGASLFELHIVFNKNMFGPDAKSSITPERFSELRKALDYVFKMRMHPVDKDFLAESEMLELRALFNKSIVLSKALPAGTILSQEHFSFKKPGSGINPDNIDDVLGKKLKSNLPSDHILSFDDLER